MNTSSALTTDRVKDLTLRALITVSPDTPVSTAVEKMRAARIGCVVIVDDEGRATGTFHEAMLVHLLAEGGDKLSDPVSAHRSPTWVRIQQKDSVAELIEAMLAQRQRFACVVDDDGRPVALTGHRALLEHLAEAYPGEVPVQYVGRTRYSSPSREGA